MVLSHVSLKFMIMIKFFLIKSAIVDPKSEGLSNIFIRKFPKLRNYLA